MTSYSKKILKLHVATSFILRGECAIAWFKL